LHPGPGLTQPSILKWSVNEYRLRLGRFKAGICDAAWCAPCSLPERLCGGVVYLVRCTITNVDLYLLRFYLLVILKQSDMHSNFRIVNFEPSLIRRRLWIVGMAKLGLTLTGWKADVVRPKLQLARVKLVSRVTHCSYLYRNYVNWKQYVRCWWRVKWTTGAISFLIARHHSL